MSSAPHVVQNKFYVVFAYPIVTAFFRLEYWLAGPDNTTPFHIMNMFLYGVCAVLFQITCDIRSRFGLLFSEVLLLLGLTKYLRLVASKNKRPLQSQKRRSGCAVLVLLPLAWISKC